MAAVRGGSGEASALDGRARRRERSHEAIVQALFELIGGGMMQPTAQQVAEAAGVGIRSVFRHFADMESLYAQIDARVLAEASPVLRGEPTPGSVAQRVRALAERRTDFFERIAPYKRAAAVQRWRSDFLRRRQAVLVRTMREDMLRWLPELIRAPGDLIDALDLVLSFEAWDRLRTDQRLGRERARDVFVRAALAVAAELEASP